MKMNNVCLSSTNLKTTFVCDRYEEFNNLKFHVESNDYFGTLATILNLILEEKKDIEEKQNQMLENAIEGLIYLQNNYSIKEKNR